MTGPSKSQGEGDFKSEAALKEWQRLYDLADRIKALAPWRWMNEHHLFGVQTASDREPVMMAFVTRSDSTHACIGYQGWAALRDAQILKRTDEKDGLSEVEIPHLELLFTNRQGVDKTGEKWIRALGKRYRGRQDWPVFRSFAPGYWPWSFTRDNAVHFYEILRQALGVALRVEDNPLLLSQEEGSCLIRKANSKTNVWEDVWSPMPDLPSSELTVNLAVETIKALQRSQKPGVRVEVNLALTQGRVQPVSDERPQSMYVLTVVDADTGLVYGVEVLQALEGIPAMWSEVPGMLINIWRDMPASSKEVDVHSDRMMNVLRPLTELLPFRLTRRTRLPRTIEMLAGLNAFFQQNRRRRISAAHAMSDSSALP